MMLAVVKLIITFSSDIALQKYHEWVSNQKYMKVVAVMIMDNFIDRFGLTIVGSLKETGLMLGNQ